MIFNKYLVLLLLLLSEMTIAFSQTDTVIVKKQKGFLFISDYNYQYDYDGSHMRPLGFHDFFFPSNCLNISCFLDSNKAITFKNGLRVDFIMGRSGIKTSSMEVHCTDTSDCYKYKKFYIVPVAIDYKLFEDYEPYVCYRNYYQIQIEKGSFMRFEYLHKAILPIRLEVLQGAKKQ